MGRHIQTSVAGEKKASKLSGRDYRGTRRRRTTQMGGAGLMTPSLSPETKGHGWAKKEIVMWREVEADARLQNWKGPGIDLENDVRQGLSQNELKKLPVSHFCSSRPSAAAHTQVISTAMENAPFSGVR